MTSPTITTERYAEDLYDLFTKLFNGVLLNASKSDTTWKHRLDTFKKVSLLEFVVPSNIKPEPLAFDESRVNDVRYRRWFVKKLQAPRPSKWTRHILPIDCDQVADDDYREKISKVLAYNWVKLLHPIEDTLHLIPIMQADVEDLEFMLDKTRLNAISAKWVFDLLLRDMAERLIEKSEKFKEIEAKLKAVAKEARDDLMASVAIINEKALADASAAFAEITEKSNRELDKTMKRIRGRLRRSQARSRKALQEHGIDPNEDRDETFRRAVKSREAERKAERKARWRKLPFIVRMLPGLATVAVATVLTFHMKVAGVTPFEWITSLIS